MARQRGIILTPDAVRDGAAQLAPLVGEALCQRRHGGVGASGYVDETDLRGPGPWSSLSRAIGRDGPLLDTRLSATRDLAAAEAFLPSAWTVTGEPPDRLTTDGHDAAPRAMRQGFGNRVTHRTHRDWNHHLEPAHRGLQQRSRPRCGFKTFATAARFWRVFAESRGVLRPQSHRPQALTLAQRRRSHQERLSQVTAMRAAA
jgi:putative transposase